MEYKSAKAYPPVAVQGKNAAYAREMLSNMGGSHSEMTAVASYFYNHLVTRPDYAEVSDVFRRISMVEMHHMEIFGQLAVLLGADPRLWAFRQGQTRYWSPCCADYSRELRPLLRTALQGELAAIRQYRYQAQTIRDDGITAMLGRIIEDEEMHVAVFEELLAQY